MTRFELWGKGFNLFVGQGLSVLSRVGGDRLNSELLPWTGQLQGDAVESVYSRDI